MRNSERLESHAGKPHIEITEHLDLTFAEFEGSGVATAETSASISLVNCALHSNVVTPAWWPYNPPTSRTSPLPWSRHDCHRSTTVAWTWWSDLWLARSVETPRLFPCLLPTTGILREGIVCLMTLRDASTVMNTRRCVCEFLTSSGEA